MTLCVGCSFIGVRPARPPAPCQSRALPILDGVGAAISVATVVGLAIAGKSSSFQGGGLVALPNPIYVAIGGTVVFTTSAVYGFSATSCSDREPPAGGAFGGACRVPPDAACDAGLTCEDRVCVLDP
jgi:hypothetical protein